jgi:hypothetical protein
MGRRKGSFKLKIGDKVTNTQETRDGVVVHVREIPITFKGWENKNPPFYDVHWTTNDITGRNRSCNTCDELVKVMPRTKEIIKDLTK